jgi:HD-GYP domain-containing protein (c-di-GMP phosphodiesterase class II)
MQSCRTGLPMSLEEDKGVPAAADTSVLRLLLDIGRHFNSSLEFPEVVKMVMDKVIEVLKAERGALFLLNEEGEPKMVAARGLDRTTIETEDFSFSRNLVNQVISSGEPVLSSNAMADPRFSSFGSVSLASIRSIMAVPIIFHDQVRGLLYVDNRIRSGIFREENLELLHAIAVQAAGAIENARLFNMKKEIILVLANAIEAKDEYTRGHVERVCSYCLAIAREISLAPEDVRDLEVCSFLHDVGKIGVPDAVLQKPGGLDPDERAQMERHSEMGESLVKPIDVPLRVKKSIRQHQERWDGRGYPDGLSGESIHIFARIIAVADTWDAMTSDRPYRKALDRAEAMRRLRDSAGSQLDPKVVEAFLRALERGEESVPVQVSLGF